jgi:hypothetical protein
LYDGAAQLMGSGFDAFDGRKFRFRHFYKLSLWNAVSIAM